MLDEIDRRLFALTREGLPLERNPYGALAHTLGISTEEVLSRLRRLCDRGVVRRVSAIVDQRRAGFMGNVMAAWAVAEDRADAAGAEIARQPEVTHCYLRKSAPGWPYNLYAMIHGPDGEACCRLVAKLTGRLGLSEPAVLPTVRELKRAPIPVPPETD